MLPSPKGFHQEWLPGRRTGNCLIPKAKDVEKRWERIGNEPERRKGRLETIPMTKVRQKESIDMCKKSESWLVSIDSQMVPPFGFIRIQRKMLDTSISYDVNFFHKRYHDLWSHHCHHVESFRCISGQNSKLSESLLVYYLFISFHTLIVSYALFSLLQSDKLHRLLACFWGPKIQLTRPGGSHENPSEF